MQQVTLARDSIVPTRKSSLDNQTQSSTCKIPSRDEMTSRKRKRVYGSALSGLTRARAKNQTCYFLTLTSAPGCKELARHWDLLVKRIRRELNYPFHYVKVETSEGNGVIHVLYHSAFDGWEYDAIHAYLSVLWEELHGSYIVWNSVVTDDKKAAGYLTQYLSEQEGFLRRSESAGWIFKGWRKKMCQLIKKMGFERGLALWKRVLIFAGVSSQGRKFEIVAKNNEHSTCRVCGLRSRKHRSSCTLEALRNGYNEMLARQSLRGYLDNTRGSMGVDTAGKGFWFA